MGRIDGIAVQTRRQTRKDLAMTFGQFISILRARWITAVVILILIVGSVVGGTLVWPKKYTASSSVVVDAKPDPISAVLYPGAASPAFMATQVDVIQSDRVALRVVRNLKLADNPQIRAQWLDEAQGEGSIELWLAGTIQQNMDVRPSRESNVITVTYKAPDPRFAAALANAFVQAYIDTTLEMRVDPAKLYSTFFDVRAKDSREALEKAQARLSAFQREKSIIASDERLDVENARLNELSSQLVALQAVSADSQSRQFQALAGAGDRMQEVLNNPLIIGMRSDITRAEARLQELGARYGDSHPQVIEAKASIAELRTRIDLEIKKVTGGVGVTNSINRSRENQTRAELEAQRSKVLRMKAVRDEGAVIQRDIESAQRSYDAVLARFNQSSLESQTNQSNVSVLSAATVPLKPSSPKLVVNSLFALFLGTFIALLAAFGRELIDRRVRSPDDIVTSLGLQVLGSLPKPGAKRFSQGRRVLLMQQRVIGLPAPTKGKGA